jgi:phenylacetate-CoA ligase
MNAQADRYSRHEALALRTGDPAAGRQYRVNLLQRHLLQASRSPFYREMFNRQGLAPADCRSLADLARLPFTTRDDLDRRPDLFCPEDTSGHRDIALTSGTTGEPVVVPYTAADLERLAFNEELAYYGAGIRPNDRVLLTVTLDRCFIAGLAYYSGLVRLGAAAIRSGPGQPARQWQIISKLKPKALVGVPSFLLQLGQWGLENDIRVDQSTITTLITIGEPIRYPDYTLTPLGRQLTSMWRADLYASYGATEFETAFCECPAGCGGHVHPELMIVEIIDENGRLLPAGQPGEVVVTPLGVEGFPLIRFRTGDVARLSESPCSCGWKTERLGPIEGRLAQRLKYKGTTLYPETIFRTLQAMDIHHCCLEIRSSPDLNDEITVIIGSDTSLRENTISDNLQASLRVRPEILIRPLAEVQKMMDQEGGRKRKTVFDLRKPSIKVNL